jgi:hypothetical protein
MKEEVYALVRLGSRSSRSLQFKLGLAFLILAIPCPEAFAQQEEFDSYKVRISAFWFHSDPTGNFQSAGQQGAGLIDIDRDLNFSTFDTFAGKGDWRFTRKNHLYVGATPFSRSNRKVLDRTIVFQGQTFDAGLVTDDEMRANLYVVGYQYDIIRRRRGHLGLAVQFNLYDTEAKISATAQVNGGVQQAARSASGSALAPIPVAGPEFRVYLTNSPRLFVEGNVYGMYFFGYGNYVSSAATLGLTLSKHISVNAGYQLGSRLVLKSSATDRIGLRLTQVGSIAGLEFSF